MFALFFKVGNRKVCKHVAIKAKKGIAVTILNSYIKIK